MVLITVRITRVIIWAVEVHLWDLLLWLLNFFCHVNFLEFCWDGMKIYAWLSYLVCMLNGNMISSDPESRWMSSCVKTICDVGCHSRNDNYWSEGIVKYSCGDVYCLYDVTWNNLLYESWQLWLWYLWGWDWDFDLLCLYLSWLRWWEANLVHCLVSDFGLWWYAGLPEGSIWCRQSTTIWPYSSHFKAIYILTMTCYVTWLLTLETAVFLMGHYIYCWWR